MDDQFNPAKLISMDGGNSAPVQLEPCENCVREPLATFKTPQTNSVFSLIAGQCFLDHYFVKTATMSMEVKSVPSARRKVMLDYSVMKVHDIPSGPKDLTDLCIIEFADQAVEFNSNQGPLLFDNIGGVTQQTCDASQMGSPSELT